MERFSIPPSSRTVRNALWSTAALFIVAAGLREAMGVLMPVTAAVMMAIICSPAVSWLERRKIPKIVAVLAVVAGAMALLMAMGALMGASIGGFKKNIPHYQQRIADMVFALLGWLKAKGLELDPQELLSKINLGDAAKNAANYIADSVSKLGGMLSQALLIVLTMVLILLEGSTVPRKLRLLSGDPEADISHFNRIASEIQSYLAIKTVLSMATGVVIGIWAAILGVDFAILWGLLAFLLNYIPNIGSIIAAVPAMVLALIQIGPGTAAALGAGYVVVNMVIGNVLEPMWMGRKLGLSTTVVFLSLIVWGEIWGPVGMLLSVPLTMVIKILLENSKEYAFIAALLGGDTDDDDQGGGDDDEASGDDDTEAPTAPSEPPPSPRPATPPASPD